MKIGLIKYIIRPTWHSGKKSACHRRHKRLEFDILVRSITWKNGNFLAWKVLWTGYSPRGHKEPDTTEHALTSSQYIMANKYMALALFDY